MKFSSFRNGADMELCSNCDIVHNERHCPLCTAKDEIADLEKRLADAKEELVEVSGELATVQLELDRMNEPLRKAVREAIS